MRAWEITMFVIIMSQFAQIFVAGIGLFPTDYLGLNGQVLSASKNVTTNQTGYTTGDYNAQTGQMITGANSGGTTDPTALSVAWAISGLLMIVSVLIIYVTVIPTLLTFFHCPLVLAIALQGLIYYSILWSLAQWKGGRSGAMIQ